MFPLRHLIFASSPSEHVLVIIDSLGPTKHVCFKKPGCRNPGVEMLNLSNKGHQTRIILENYDHPFNHILFHLLDIIALSLYCYCIPGLGREF